MKLGFENKRETRWMIGLVIVAIIAAGWSILSPSPVTQAAKKQEARPVAGNNPLPANARRLLPRRKLLKDLTPSDDPSIRFDLLKSSEEKEYDGGKRNIFQEYVEQVKIDPPKVPVTDDHKPAPGPAPYVPPPIPLKYYGFANKAGETRKIFLSNGDEVFIAEEGQIIQRRYKVGKITPSSVEIEDVLNNQKQTIPLTQG